MKVLLLTHVNKVGREGEIVDVADGFAINSLFPQKKAVQATAKIVNDFSTKVKADKEKEAKQKASTIETLKALDGAKVVIKSKVNDKGSLYQSIGVKEIVKAILDQHKKAITPTLFKGTYALKEVGDHEVTLEGYGVKSTFTLTLSGE